MSPPFRGKIVWIGCDASNIRYGIGVVIVSKGSGINLKLLENDIIYVTEARESFGRVAQVL